MTRLTDTDHPSHPIHPIIDQNYLPATVTDDIPIVGLELLLRGNYNGVGELLIRLGCRLTWEHFAIKVDLGLLSHRMLFVSFRVDRRLFCDLGFIRITF